MSTTNAAMIQKGDTHSQKQRLESTKYQESLPWESRHISPYIPLLEPQFGYMNDFELHSDQNYEMINSFKPFITSCVDPVRQTDGYSELLQNNEADAHARYTMDQLKQFILQSSRPQLASEPALLNIKYRSRIDKVLEEYQKTVFHRIPEPTVKPKSPQEYQSDEVFEQPKNIILGSQAPSVPIKKYHPSHGSSNAKNLTNDKPKLLGKDAASISLIGKTANSTRETEEFKSTLPTTQPMKRFDHNRFADERKKFSEQLCFNYDSMLTGEGRIVVGEDGQSWNNKSHAYLAKLESWSSDDKVWAENCLKEYAQVPHQFFLPPRAFRELRPIDRVSKEMVQMSDGSMIPYETTIERRSVEVMHQRDYLVKPMLVTQQNGQVEKVNDVTSYDRSFIIEQNNLNRSEIFHEYPVHLTQEQLFEFLYSTGIDVETLDCFRKRVEQPTLRSVAETFQQVHEKVSEHPTMSLPRSNEFWR